MMADIAASLYARDYADVMMHPIDVEFVDVKAVIAGEKAMARVRIASIADAANIPADTCSHSNSNLSFSIGEQQSSSLLGVGSLSVLAGIGGVIAAVIISRRQRKNRLS
jgi:hypothetical protein